MKKLLPYLILSYFFAFNFATNSFAQAATDSATATESAATTSGSVELPETLPSTGSTDVIVMFVFGLIFLSAGYTTSVSTRKLWQDID